MYDAVLYDYRVATDDSVALGATAVLMRQVLWGAHWRPRWRARLPAVPLWVYRRLPRLTHPCFW